MAEDGSVEIDEEELARINAVKAAPRPELSLHQAARINEMTVVDKLISEGKAKINDIDEFGKSALHYACEKNFVKLIGALVDRGADINLAGHSGRTPLHLSSMKGCRLSVAKLLEYPGQVDLDKQDAAGNTGLLYAARDGSLRIVDLLLGAGADLAATNKAGACAIHLATLGLAEPVVTMLAERGIDIQHVDQNDDSSLHWAARMQDPELAKLLKTIGVDVTRVNAKGQKPLDFASKYSREALDKVLTV